MSTPQEIFDRAVQLHRTGQIANAVPLYQELLRSQPALHDVWHQLGNALKSLLRFDEALPALREAARLAPKDATIRLNLGVTLLELKHYPDAEAQFREALTLEPGRPEAHNILGNALFAQGKLTEAAACFEKALRLRKDYAPAYDNLGRVYRAQARIAEAVASYRAALALQPRPGTHSNLLLALNYLPGIPPAEILAEHRRWAARYAEPLTSAAHPLQRDSPVGRRLRIGYLSPDFSNHAVAYFFEPVLTAHDRGECEVFCYSNVSAPDNVTERLRASAEHWREIASLSDDEAVALIRRDGLDLLVDLAGHTARNRLLVFARRAAPVQVTWIGYPNTTGLSAMDFRLTDHASDPAGRADGFYSEKLLRLPGPFSVYRPPADAPGISAAPPASKSGVVTFGSFNNFAKVSDATLSLWVKLLQSKPASRLFLRSRGLDDAETAARICATFERAGVEPDRLRLDGRELSVTAHLALYADVDVALDPFPYNGTTTTCEALWMGVPVVTLAGDTHVSRVGASLLTHLGVAEWIASTPEEYCEKARYLARHGEHPPATRLELRERMRRSPLCDAETFTRNLERVFRQICS